MKNLVLPLLFAVSLTACSSKHNPSTERQLLQMLEKKDIFRLQTRFEEKKTELSQSIVLYLEAHLQNAFNQTEQSSRTINTLLGNYSRSLSDTLLCKVYEIKSDNLFKQSRYRESAEALKIAIDKYGYTMDSVDLADNRDSYNIIEPLQEFPPQKIHITTDVTIPVSHNQFGHMLMSVMKDGQSEDFIFDTGANLSVVSESCAKRMGIRVLESSSDIGNSSGSKVKSKVGIADSLWIGALLLENVAFLVLSDESLSFPEINYAIPGIIGFPVLYQMKEIAIGKESITVSVRPTKRSLHNLFFDGLSPIVRLEANGDTVRFKMDTGANKSEFSKQYFIANNNKIVENATKKTEKRGSAGSLIENEVYELKNVPLKIGGRELTVPSIDVQTGEFSFLKDFDGNLGQDILSHFNKLILNFEDMYLAFDD